MAYIDCTDPTCELHGDPCPDCGRERMDAHLKRKASIVVCDYCGWVSECGNDPPFSMRLGEQGTREACSVACARRILAQVAP